MYPLKLFFQLQGEKCNDSIYIDSGGVRTEFNR